ncbi:MAG: hypothetical protein A2X94_16400 [Bdellovibrionales bacterium GWB1_55_8]|nr:MAG: hypothetical protein A2X94_16400 [Bdellovibrionales bacterium GWB1_55_8]
MSFSRLTDILRKVQAQNPVLSKRIKEAEALSRWEIAVGPQIAKHARAVRVHDSCLWVEVDHPIWRSELHHRKRQILEKLNTPQEPAGGQQTGKPVATIIQDLYFI